MSASRAGLSRPGWVAAVALACAAVSVAGAEPRASLADGAVGKIEFQSHTTASQRPLLARSYTGQPPVVVSGVLSLPATGAGLDRAGRSPAVILAHGTGGITDEREHAWARRLAGWGIAAFVVDSYTGRGIRPPSYADTPNYTHFTAHLLDAYRALELLATHPRIDGARVAVMGFSRGGEVAVNAVFERFRAGALGDDAARRFAAHVSFYPYCNFRHTSKALSTAPLLMLLGGADEMTEPGPCQRLAQGLEAVGLPVKLVVYPGAHHGFDRLRPVALDRAYAGVRSCEAEYDLDAMVVRRLDTGAALATSEDNADWLRECRTKGARFGGDPRAREASIEEVRRFLSDVFSR
jgi:dienelactone hydrolase